MSEIYELLRFSADQSHKALKFLLSTEAIRFMSDLSEMLAKLFALKGKVLIAGNGGSLCDAAHFAEELTGRFRNDRPALAAIALSEPGHMSCVANDFGYESVFSRSIEALGSRGDVFIALSTSGNSSNLTRAVEQARLSGMQVVTLLGKDGGELRGQADLELVVPGQTTSDRIQEVHMAALHMVVEAVEARLFAGAR